MIKKIKPVLLGNVLETYDFCLYGLLAPVFAKVFFPDNFQHSLTCAFLLFAIAYLSRPFGSILWGHVGDKYGRKYALIGTLGIMAVSAVGMAIVPSYNQIGYWACCIILVLRFLQGLAFGGDYPATMVALYELAPKNRKGVYCSLISSATCFGHLIAILCILSVLIYGGKSFLHDNGWRILFGISIIFIALIGYIRKNLTETLTDENKNKRPLLTTIIQWRGIFRIFFYLFTANVLFFSYVYHINAFFRNNQGLSDTNIFIVQAFMMVYLIILIPIISYVGDLFGRVKFVKYALVILVILSIPIYILILSKYFFVGIVILGFFVSTMSGLSFSIIVEHAKTNCRMSMCGISHGLGVIVFGATTPMLNTIMIKFFNSEITPSFYLMFAAMTSLVALCLIERKNIVNNMQTKKV